MNEWIGAPKVVETETLDRGAETPVTAKLTSLGVRVPLWQGDGPSGIAPKFVPLNVCPETPGLKNAAHVIKTSAAYHLIFILRLPSSNS
jgi:hypothetical protein